MPEEWTPEEDELPTLSVALCIDPVPVVRHFGRYILPIRAVLLTAGFSYSPLFIITTANANEQANITTTALYPGRPA